MNMPHWKHFMWIVVGGMAGFAWYYFVGCASGTCPISSNPYISTGYGALIGALASQSTSKPKENEKNP